MKLTQLVEQQTHYQRNISKVCVDQLNPRSKHVEIMSVKNTLKFKFVKMKNQASCQHNYNIDHPMSHKEKIEGEVMEKENQKPG